MLIRNKRLYEKLSQEGIDNVLLYKANNYFFLTSDDNATLDKLANLEGGTMIYCNSFSQQSIQQWVDDIKEILKNAE